MSKLNEDISEIYDFLTILGQEEAAKVDVNAHKRFILSLAKDKLFLDRLNDVLQTSMADKYYVGQQYKPKKNVKTQRILNLVLSDLHYGALLDNKEVPLQYGHVEEARRTAAVVLQTAEYKLDHRDETELYVHLLGDVIQNHLYDLRDGAPLAEQAASAIHLLTQAITFLSGKFKKVTVFCTTGNHGRDKSRHPERAVNQKWDSHETVIYYAVKTATQHLKNVEVNIPRTPFYTFKAFDMYGYCTHGDNTLNPGYPNRAINVGNVQKQINEINGKLEANEKYKLFIVGHVHVASCTRLPNNVVFMSNGCLLPTDSYAQSIGIVDTACCQILFESVPGCIVGDRRDINLTENTDKDKSLDVIIKPFASF
jgi:hypothetical protein